MTVTIVRAEMTCLACPSQWDAWDSEGRYWYLRFRGGRGQARQYASGPDWHESWSPAGGEEPAEALEFLHGDPLDGFITLDEFARLAGLELELPLEYWEQHADDGQVIAEAAQDVLAWLKTPAGEVLSLAPRGAGQLESAPGEENRDDARPDEQARGEEGGR